MRHPDHYRPATTNAGFWQRKVDEDRSRELETDKALAEAGWAVLRFWEHDNPAAAAEVVARAVRRRAASGSRSTQTEPQPSARHATRGV